MKCLSPIQIKNPNTCEYIDVPCGKCPACLIRYRDGWKWRLSQEFRSYGFQGLFTTFTYSDDLVPIQDVCGYPIQVLRKSDLQTFLKSLRNKVDYYNKSNDEKINFKYFAVGEYGSHTFRPHYHSLFFSNNLDFIKEFVSLNWSCGFIEIKDIIEEHLQYVCKYTLKQLIPYCQDLDIPLPFAFMSKGIGLSYLSSSEFIDGHYSFKPYVYDFKGYKISMPRYVRNHSYSLDIWSKNNAIVREQIEQGPSLVSQWNDMSSLSYHLQSIIDKQHDLDQI